MVVSERMSAALGLDYLYGLVILVHFIFWLSSYSYQYPTHMFISHHVSLHTYTYTAWIQLNLPVGGQ